MVLFGTNGMEKKNFFYKKIIVFFKRRRQFEFDQN